MRAERLSKMSDELLVFARGLGQEASRQLVAWRGRAAASEKGDGTVITEADRAVDRFLGQQIRSRYPDHAVLSEEGEMNYAGRPFTWVIDPLDGTTNFALGLYYWGCSIALVHEGQPTLGVVTMPMLGAEYWAQRGGGAFLNGQRLGGPPQGVSERNSFLAMCSRTWRYLRLPMPQKARLLGSAAYDLAALAQGTAVGVCQLRSHIWDLAAGWLIAKEAGRALGRLFPDAPDPFPMAPAADYEHRVFPLAGGADEGVLRMIQQRVRVRSEAADHISAWSAAGWDLSQIEDEV